MSEMSIGARMYDIFVSEPVSFWTGKDAKEVRPLDALPLYVGAALWPLALLGIAGCDDGYGGESEDTEGDYDTDTHECVNGDTMTSYSGPPETNYVGICMERIDWCNNGFWETVQEEVLPQEEVFGSGIDENCNGYVDEIDLDGDVVLNIYDSSIQPAFIRLRNGARLVFHSQEVAINTDFVEIDSTSAIEMLPNACGPGNGTSGTGSHDGGGGGGASNVGQGGYGGNGGWQGIGGVAGPVYGSADDFIAEPGSCGGNGGGPYGGAGGKGGGALTIVAESASIMGAVIAKGGIGTNAPYDDGGGGGGSGGSIVLDVQTLTVSLASTILSVRGGNGGQGGPQYATGGGGGGGGGGSIEIKFNEAVIQSVAVYSAGQFGDFIDLISDYGCLVLDGGFGFSGGTSGQPGAVNSSIQ